nr:PTS sugar transporter subunit IIC [Allobacillus halotolerans]
MKEKGIEPSFQNYAIKALSYMASGLFASLIIGVIFKTLGDEVPNIPAFFSTIGDFAIQPIVYGGAVGVAIAHGLRAPSLVLYSALFAGAYGAMEGGPAGSFIAALVAIELGKIVSGETKIDIVVTPFFTILVGYLMGSFVGPYISSALIGFGEIIVWATDLQPFLMGAIIAALMGVALTAPISSVAIAIMLDLEGLAAGAATIGCVSQMVGFAVGSFRENGFGGLISQGLGTSMLQIGNIVRKPILLLPPTLTGLLLGPIATVWLQLENNAYGAGMGTSGLVGPIMTLDTMGYQMNTFVIMLIFYLLVPAILSLVMFEWMRKKGYISPGDLKLDIN